MTAAANRESSLSAATAYAPRPGTSPVTQTTKTPPRLSPSAAASSIASIIAAEAARSGHLTSLESTFSGSNAQGSAGCDADTPPMASTYELTRTPIAARKAFAIAPAATRAAVSRALARSSTSRTSSLPILSTPGRSACPGLGAVTRTSSGRAPSTDMTSVQLSQSRLEIVMATGLPMVRPKRIPDSTLARSLSIFIRPPRPYPNWRRESSASISAMVTGTPAGTPDTMVTRALPWDSPAVT